MTVDPANVVLATADVEGNVKIWNIATYCLVEGKEECMFEPRELLFQLLPFFIPVSSILIYEIKDLLCPGKFAEVIMK